MFEAVCSMVKVGNRNFLFLLESYLIGCAHVSYFIWFGNMSGDHVPTEF